MFKLNYFGDGLTNTYRDKWPKRVFQNFVYRSKIKQLMKLNYLQSLQFLQFLYLNNYFLIVYS